MTQIILQIRYKFSHGIAVIGLLKLRIISKLVSTASGRFVIPALLEGTSLTGGDLLRFAAQFGDQPCA